MFRELLSPSFLDEAQTTASIPRNNSLYTPLVVMWLMVAQRLHGAASLEAAVIEFLRGLPASFWPNPCKRVRRWHQNGELPSSNTGAYNQARQQLPLSVVEQSCDRIFDQLATRMKQTVSEEATQAFLLDGSSMRMAHSPSLCQLYPPGSNLHGEGHWPLVRILVAHDLYTGLAMRPEWGPMHGEEAVSEQGLLEQCIDRLPKRSAIIGDANFGVFSVAWAATERQHPVVLRLTVQRAQSLVGGPLHDGIDRQLVWKPSRYDRKAHPDLPADACVPGRLIVRKVQPDNGAAPFLLALFTTLPSEKAFALYWQRWAIETDLRTLKSTLCLDQLTCTTPDMVAKEIQLGITAYNLVRAVIAVASQQSGIPPRGYSFTKVRRIVEAFGPALANAPDQQAAKRIFDQMMQLIGQSKLPRRRRKRLSYSRTVWKRGRTFPNRT